MHISDDVTDSNAKRFQACIVPVRFNSFVNINDKRYVTGDRTLRMVLQVNGRKASVEFL